LGSNWKLNHGITEGIRRKVEWIADEVECGVTSSLPNPSSYKHKFTIKPAWIVSSQRVFLVKGFRFNFQEMEKFL